MSEIVNTKLPTNLFAGKTAIVTGREPRRRQSDGFEISRRARFRHRQLFEKRTGSKRSR